MKKYPSGLLSHFFYNKYFYSHSIIASYFKFSLESFNKILINYLQGVNK